MKAFQIFCDSSCDLPDSLIKEHEIKVIPFYVSFDRDTYYKENIDISNESFYDSIDKSNEHPTTSLPSVQDYMNAFKESLSNGEDVLCICLSHKLSGSYQSAVNAGQILEEQYPGSRISIIDSIQATGGQGLLILQASYMKKAGLSIDQIEEVLNIQKSTARIMFSVDTLEYLEKGRRIGKVAALTGDMLDVKPLIQLEGAELVPYSRIRGRKKSLEALTTMVEDYFRITGEQYGHYDFAIVSANSPEDAQYLQGRTEELLGHPMDYPVFQIGVTIGTYTGPGGIGICFVKKYNYIEGRQLS